MKLSELGERGFLELVREWTSGDRPGLVLGAGDDAALLEPSRDREIALSVDSFREGIHFNRASFSAFDIGHKIAAASLSDLAAIGAMPQSAFVALFAPADESVEFLRDVYRGMRRVADPLGVSIAGGDTVEGPLAFAITVVGTVEHERALRRDGAEPGDIIYASGTLGKSEAGRLLLEGAKVPGISDASREVAVAAHLRPTPRFDIVRFLRGTAPFRTVFRPTSMIDVSDGLGIDLARVAQASEVGVRVEEARIPVDDAARHVARERGGRDVDLALSGGEDFELVFTIRESERSRLETAAGAAGLSLHAIGVITAASEGRVLVREDGRATPWPEAGFDHYRSGSER